MKKRQIIVNRKFQVHIAASFAAVTAVTMAAIIIMLSAVLILNNLMLEGITRNQQTLSGTQGEIFKTLIALSTSKNLKNVHISTTELQHDNENTKVLLDQNNEKIKNITERNKRLILILIISAVVQSIIVFYLMIRRSHRISGPVFLLNRYIKEMKNGGYPEIRPLRTNDDFQELFKNFRELADMMRGKSITNGNVEKTEKVVTHEEPAMIDNSEKIEKAEKIAKTEKKEKISKIVKSEDSKKRVKKVKKNEI